MHADETPEIDVVIPALNEEARIGATLRELTLFLETLPQRSRVTVIDNGSVDRTAEVVGARYATDVPIRLVGCAARGKGAAVRRGLATADAPVVGFCDADLSTPVDTIGRAVPLVQDGHDIVIGSRRVAGARYVTAQPLPRRVGSYAFRRLSASVVGDVSDTQCGFKFFRRDVARRLAAESRLDGFAFDIELLGLAREAGYSVTEIPVSWTDDPGSSFSARTHGLQAFGDVRRARRRFSHPSRFGRRAALAGS